MTKVLGALAALALLLVLVLPAFAAQGDDNLPCTVGGHWILSGNPQPTGSETFTGLTFDKYTGNAVHYTSGPVDATNFAAIASQDERLKLSHCIGGTPSQTPSSSPSVPPTGTPGPTITPAPSPSVVPSPTPTYTSSPSPSASSTPTATPSTPTLSPSPTVVPTPPSTPLPTPPATDTEPTSTTGSGFPWLLAVMAGIVGGTVFALRKNTR